MQVNKNIFLKHFFFFNLLTFTDQINKSSNFVWKEFSWNSIRCGREERGPPGGRESDGCTYVSPVFVCLTPYNPIPTRHVSSVQLELSVWPSSFSPANSLLPRASLPFYWSSLSSPYTDTGFSLSVLLRKKDDHELMILICCSF